MGETAKEWMIGQNTYFWDRCIGDSQYLGHDMDIFANMVMKWEFPNQGWHGLLWAKEKDTTSCDGKNLFYQLKFEMCFIQLPK
jgi:hypothetical protein